MAQPQSPPPTRAVTQSPFQNSSAAPAAESVGVDSLIDRLREQGIAQGRTQGEQLLIEARKQASDLLASAQQQAEAVLNQAKEEAAKLKAAGEHAIALALRDTILSLEDGLAKQFENTLRRLVGGSLADPAFLQRLVLEIAGKAPAAIQGQRVELLLPAELVSLEDLQRAPEQATPGTLMHFVLSMGGDMLRQGMTFGVDDDAGPGIRVRLVDQDVRLDFTDSALAELLLRHMLPRYRALLRGKFIAERTEPVPRAAASVASVAGV